MIQALVHCKSYINNGFNVFVDKEWKVNIMDIKKIGVGSSP